MRPLSLFVLFLLSPSLVFAQAAPAEPSSPSAPPTLPVKRVVLYKTGVGYFEHLGNVIDRQNVGIAFTSGQLNDVVKSLTVIDLGKGRIASINYNSVAPLDQRIGSLRLPLNQGASAPELLGTLRGARVEVSAPGSTTQGRFLSIERQNRTTRDQTQIVDSFSIVTDSGEIRNFELGPAVRIRIVDRQLRHEIGRYLDLVGSVREQDVRTLTISSVGSGERPLFVSYISEVPIWKSTYRLVFPPKGKPFLQGWAIIDNTTGVDWQGVELSLVAGAPQSFIQPISHPYYSRRPIVPMPSSMLLAPQTHQPTLRMGSGVARGLVTDPARGVLPGVRVTLSGPEGEVASAFTNAQGRYEINAPTGSYTMNFELTGFQSSRRAVSITAGGQSVADATLQLGALGEAVTVTGESTLRSGVAAGIGGGRFVPAPPPPPAAPMPYQQMRDLAPAAAAGELGELFEYKITEAVTLTKNQSALVPIVNADVDAERVSLWNRTSGSGRPLRAIWLTNSSALTLDGGSMTIVDGNAFAGEGLVTSLKPSERRLVSYGADLGLLVSVKSDGVPSRIRRVRAFEGMLIQESEDVATWTYSARNEDASARTLVIEHPTRDGWRLVAGQGPAEETPDTQRFRLNVPSKQEALLVVRDIKDGETRVVIADMDDKVMARLSAGGISADALQKAMAPIIEAKSVLSGFERQMADFQARHEVITRDQQRLRENMKALRGSAEEKQLLQRYTRQLNQQEDELAKMLDNAAKIAKQRDEARAELVKRAAGLTFELHALDR